MEENSDETADTQEALESFIFEYCSEDDSGVTITGELSSFEKIRPAEDYTL
jgi:hypothetical protein